MSSRVLKYAKTFKSFYTGRYAVVTNTVTAGVIGLMADSVCQTLEIKAYDKSWDKERTKNMTIVSAAFTPGYHFWYRYLDFRFPGKSRSAISKKVFLDLAIAPLCYVFYIGLLGKLKKQPIEDTVVEFKTKVPILLTADAVLWPILQSFNFLLFPPHYRIIGLKINEFLMGILISHIVNNQYSFRKFITWIAPKAD